jgi:S1-C subfamily serine protease
MHLGRIIPLGLMVVVVAGWSRPPDLPVPPEGQMMMVSTGTGFFVNSAGYLITNNHVVQNCKSIIFRGSTNSDHVELVATDETNDLALLRMDGVPKYTAPMRYNEGLKPGHMVMIIGYPLDSIFQGEYVIRTATVMDTKGPMGEENWLQFSDSAKHGNSGGPLLDASGNVIGVVTGKMTLYDIRTDQVEKKADIAITMPILKKFLDDNFIPYDNLISYDEIQEFRDIDTADIERNAGKFITGVVCIQGAVDPNSTDLPTNGE